MSDAVAMDERPPQVFVVPSNADSAEHIGGSRLEMEFLVRVAQLPVVDQTVSVVSNLYGKVKDSNSAVGWTLETAKSTIDHATDTLSESPCFVKTLEKVNYFLCSSLDYVEDKVPTVKMPPQEILKNGKQYMAETWSWVCELGAAKSSDLESYFRRACALAVPYHAEKATGTDKSSSDAKASSPIKPDMTVYTTLAEVVEAIEQLELAKMSLKPGSNQEKIVELPKESEPNLENENTLLEAGKNELNLKTE